MRNLSMLLVVLSLITSSVAPALETCNPQEREKCKAALDAADSVIQKQDELALKLSDSNSSLRSENDTLSAALVKMKNLNDQDAGRVLTYGLLGVVGGALATALILGRH